MISTLYCWQTDNNRALLKSVEEVEGPHCDDLDLYIFECSHNSLLNHSSGDVMVFLPCHSVTGYERDWQREHDAATATGPGAERRVRHAGHCRVSRSERGPPVERSIERDFK